MTSASLGSVGDHAGYRVATPEGMPCHRLVETSLQTVGKEASREKLEHSLIPVHVVSEARGPEGWAPGA